MRQTVIARILGAYTVIALAGLIALGTTTLLSLARGSRDRALTEMEARAELAVSIARTSLAPEELAGAVPDLALGETTVILLAADGTITAASGPYPRLPLTTSSIASLEQPVSGMSSVTATGARSAYAITPFVDSDERLGFLYISRPVGGVLNEMRESAIPILVAATVIAVIMGLLA